MEKQLTVIIPSYNMEAYLEKCLTSLLIPELDEVEILVVNDGSKDKTLEIASRFQNQYPSSIRVIDKPNGNYGSCVNIGLSQAKGKYVKILDADDSFDNEAFSKFIRELRGIDSDVVLTDYVIVDENNNDTEIHSTGFSSTQSHLDFSAVLPVISRFNQMHGIAYSLKLLKNLNYRQTEGISYTDTEWTFIPLASANRYSFASIGNLYRYLVGREGQTMDPAIFFRKLPEQFTVLLSRATNFEKYKDTLDPLRKGFLLKSFTDQSHYIYLAIVSSDNSDAKAKLLDYENQLKEVSPELYNHLEDLNYTPSTPYKFVKKFRQSKNPESFTISKTMRFVRKICKVINPQN